MVGKQFDFFLWNLHENYFSSAVSQPGENILASHCPLSSSGATADRQLVLWTIIVELRSELVWTEQIKRFNSTSDVVYHLGHSTGLSIVVYVSICSICSVPYHRLSIKMDNTSLLPAAMEK